MSRESRSLLAELQRRKVYRTAAVYAGIAWAVLQIADLAFPRLGLPDWTVTLTLAIAAVGFPLAILVAWHFDITSEGIQRTTVDEASVVSQRSPFRAFEFLLILGLVVAVGYLYLDRLGIEGTGPADPPTIPVSEARSIAVLPFVNMSQDPDNEYFSDGVAEQILDALARVKQLRVAARTSSFSFKGRNEDIREIGLRLGVATILEGSVRKSGNRLRITAQLVNTSDGYHLWSETYDRELTDIFAVQDEIARSIATALQIPLGLSPDMRIVRAGTTNTAAYNDYLRGLYHFKMIEPENYQKTVEYMESAIARDPRYAAPYGVLASTHMISALWLPREHVFSEAKIAFERALELDPTLGIALIARAQYEILTDWDWSAARQSFDLAVADRSDPTLTAFAYSTLYLIPLGQLDEASRLIADAEIRDPLDPRLKLIKASIALLRGDTPQAIAQYRLTLDIDASNFHAASGLCLAYVQMGDPNQAKSLQADWEIQLGHFHPWLLACKAYTALALGNLEAALLAYEELERASSDQPGLAFFAGDVALSLGRIDDAVDWWERSLDEGELGLTMTRMRHKGNAGLIENERYRSLLARMRLDDASLARIPPKRVSAIH